MARPWRFKLGKRPARRGSVKFRLRRYFPRGLPGHPDQFGHDTGIGPDWGMLGNDQVGDCVLAGAAHETMLWTSEGGNPATFTDATVLAAYSAITGYDPASPDTDQGTDMQAAAAYRQKTGIADAAGNAHQVAAYLAIEPGNWDELLTALYLFGAVGMGFQFPGSAMDQTDAGKPWDVVSGADIEGGHYVPAVAMRDLLVGVTWGKEQLISRAFYEQYADEAIVYLSDEMLTGGKSPEGFDADALAADLAALK